MRLTWLGIVVIAILLLMGYSGYRRGFIKEILSFFFVFLAVALAGVFNSGVSTFLKEKTPLYETLQGNINGLSYLISYVMASLAIKAASCILDIIAGLPLINTANRFTGALIGLLKGIVFIWLAFLFITVLYSTDIGKQGLDLIQKDSFLSVLYRYDVFVRILIQ